MLSIRVGKTILYTLFSFLFGLLFGLLFGGFMFVCASWLYENHKFGVCVYPTKEKKKHTHTLSFSIHTFDACHAVVFNANQNNSCFCTRSARCVDSQNKKYLILRSKWRLQINRIFSLLNSQQAGEHHAHTVEHLSSHRIWSDYYNCRKRCRFSWSQQNKYTKFFSFIGES